MSTRQRVIHQKERRRRKPSSAPVTALGGTANIHTYSVNHFPYIKNSAATDLPDSDGVEQITMRGDLARGLSHFHMSPPSQHPHPTYLAATAV
jgi:hypothetical protein